MSVMSAAQTGGATDTSPGTIKPARRGDVVRLVRRADVVMPGPRGEVVRPGCQAAVVRPGPQAGVRTGPRVRADSGRRPAAIALTRRGRVVLAIFALLIAGAVLTLIWLSAAGGAQASDHGVPPRAAYRGLTQIVVRPGQTLWSIAVAAEPHADPRLVSQQIVDVNALPGATIRAGQLLWVPRG